MADDPTEPPDDELSKQRKKESGAQGRKRRAAEADAAADGEFAEGRDPTLLAEWRAAYEGIGPPPEDVVGRVTWAQRMLAQALYETAVDPGTSPRERRRVIGDLGAKVGITAVRALYEERLKRIEGQVFGAKDESDASDGLDDYEPPDGDKET